LASDHPILDAADQNDGCGVCLVTDAMRFRSVWGYPNERQRKMHRWHCRHGSSSMRSIKPRSAWHQNRLDSREQQKTGKALWGDLTFEGRSMTWEGVNGCGG
jgi:hypothetical protein